MEMELYENLLKWEFIINYFGHSIDWHEAPIDWNITLAHESFPFLYQPLAYK